MKNRAGTLMLSIAVAVAAPHARAADPATSGTSDSGFLEQALGVNELELQLGQLATERGSSAELKETAKKMVEKHTSLGKQLSALSKQAGGSGVARLTAEQEETLKAMRAEPARSFDASFKKTVDAGHVDELAMYRAEVDRASDPALRALAQDRVTALERAVAEARAGTSATQGTGGAEW